MSGSAQEPGSPAGRGARAGWRSGRWRGRSVVVVVLAVVMLVAGCGQGRTGEGVEGVTPGEFVEVIAALREAERAVAWEDSAAALFAERKAEILAREGVTEAELRAFVAARDASELEQLWDAIARRLRHVPEEGVAPFPRVPGDEEPDEARDEVPVDPGDDPGARTRRDMPRRGPPPFPSPPIPADTGERRLH